MRQFTLSIGDPWDFEGPDGDNKICVELQGIVGGPKKENWASSYLLLSVKHPFEMSGERVECLVASPRYEGTTVAILQEVGGIVGCARVKPGVKVSPKGSFEAGSVVYCLIGEIRPNDT